MDEYLRNGMVVWRAYRDTVYRGDPESKEAYDTCRANGARLLANDSIKAALHERMRQEAMQADEVLHRLAAIARASIEDIAEIGDYLGKPRLRINPAKAVEAGKGYLIKEIKETKDGIEVKLHDAHAALRDIGKAHGVFGAKGTADDPVHTKGVGDHRAVLLDLYRRRRQAKAGDPESN